VSLAGGALCAKAKVELKITNAVVAKNFFIKLLLISILRLGDSDAPYQKAGGLDLMCGRHAYASGHQCKEKHEEFGWQGEIRG
jgi:hypothetical protein